MCGIPFLPFFFCRGRHYYWDTDTDVVSWLPPAHPRASISMCAANLREERHLAEGDHDDEDDDDDEEEEEKDDAPEEMEVQYYCNHFILHFLFDGTL